MRLQSNPLGPLLLVLLAAAATAQPNLRYQFRGDRFEGLQPRPVSRYDVELLSAVIDAPEPIVGWPDTLRLRFFLGHTDDVHITVRELDYREYYWLDRLTPARPWRRGAFNDYAWPTAPVLAHLDALSMSELGVVARLERAQPGRREVVTPVAFFAFQPPPSATYRFVFKTNGRARIRARLDRDGRPIWERPERRELAQRPFTLIWPGAGQPEGWYRLVLSGYFETDNSRLDKEVSFYHKPG